MQWFANLKHIFYLKNMSDVETETYYRLHYHLPCTISSTDSENQEEHLCTRDKVKGQTGCVWSWGSHMALNLKTDMILSWASLHGLWNTFVNTGNCNSQMQVKAVSWKEETIHEHNPEMLPSSLGQSSSKMIWGKSPETQQKSRTAEQLESCIRLECDNIPLLKVQQLVFSLSRHLLTVFDGPPC